MDRTFLHARDQIVEGQRQFILKVYNWMSSGLFITGLIAYYVSNTPYLVRIIFGNSMIFYALIFGELGIVFLLMARVNNMSAQTAKMTFFGYAALNGVTISVIFYVFTRSSIASAFIVTSGTFAAMSFYGYTTKKDITSWGSFLFMGLAGIIIGSFVNMFMQSEMIYWLTTYAGIIIFVGLTAYDTQKIKMMYKAGNVDGVTETRQAVIGALVLYLDFINLFILLLRITGSRRD